ncbi:MAG TPA: hypothetical protein PLQ49_07630, partial [Methanothrix sp.]|nr:hypothetical protein [Methanothrix sp.]
MKYSIFVLIALLASALVFGLAAAQEDVTPDDIKETFQFFHNDKIVPPSPLSPTMTNITHIDTDAHSITFKLKEQDVSFLQNFVIGILPAKLKDHPILSFAQHIGCGPYTMAE